MRLLPVTYDPSVVLNGVKSLSYGANMLASRRAVAAGYDEALLVRAGRSCARRPACSIFWVRDGRLQTPALETGILASITRRVILESMPVEEGSFALEHAAGAEEAFLASTARLAQPIAAIGEVAPARGAGAADAEGPGGDRAGDGRGLDRLIRACARATTGSRSAKARRGR